MNEHKTIEHYLLRYLSGSIFGVLILIYLAVNYDQQISKSFFDSNQTVVVKNTKEFLFDNEKSYENSKIEKEISKVSLASIIMLFVVALLYMYASSMPLLFLHTFRWVFYKDNGKYFQLTKYYKDLSKQRAIDRKSNHEFIDSYRKLRENGNAFGILLSEILFASFLINTNFSIYWIAFWFSIGLISWFVATYLEFRLVKGLDNGI